MLINEQAVQVLEGVADETVGLVAPILLLFLALLPLIPAPVAGDAGGHARDEPLQNAPSLDLASPLQVARRVPHHPLAMSRVEFGEAKKGAAEFLGAILRAARAAPPFFSCPPVEAQ